MEACPVHDTSPFACRNRLATPGKIDAFNRYHLRRFRSEALLAFNGTSKSENATIVASLVRELYHHRASISSSNHGDIAFERAVFSVIDRYSRFRVAPAFYDNRLTLYL